ncbi:MAG: hypothetical protein AB7K71_14765 [Polyangiaceae bacterium]
MTLAATLRAVYRISPVIRVFVAGESPWCRGVVEAPRTDTRELVGDADDGLRLVGCLELADADAFVLAFRFRVTPRTKFAGALEDGAAFDVSQEKSPSDLVKGRGGATLRALRTVRSMLIPWGYSCSGMLGDGVADGIGARGTTRASA